MFTIFEDKYFWKEDIDKQDTHWYKFQEAVKEHESKGLKLLRPIFLKMGVEIENS